MAYESVAITPGSGKNIAVDTVDGKELQVFKLDAGGDGVSVPVVAGQQAMAASVPVVVASNQTAIPVADGGGTITVDGTVAVTNADLTTLAGAVAATHMQADIVGALPAGTNNIGDIDVAEKTLSIVTGTKAGAGDNELIAAPAAGNRLVVSSFVMQNESTTATTMILSDGAADKIRCLGQNQGDGLAMNFPAGREWKLSEATALNINLSGANQCGYSVIYWTEAV